MKKGVIVLLVLFMLSLTSSEPILELQGEDIQIGETILATIALENGEFSQEIAKENILFFEGRKKVSFESNIEFHEGTHYLYVYTTRKGNFTMQIKDILYKEENTLQSKTIEKKIEIKNKEIKKEDNTTTTQILSIKPGFLFTSTTGLVKLTNVGEEAINITLNEDEEIFLEPQKSFEKEILPKSNFEYLTISTYKNFKVPIISFSPNKTVNETTKELELKANTKQILENLIEKESNTINITLFNFADKNITIDKITTSIEFLKIEEFNSLSAREAKNITLEFNPQISGHFKGTLNISYSIGESEDTLSIPLSLFVLPPGSTNDDFEIKTSQTCEDLGGKVCSVEPKEICNGRSTFTKGSIHCCLAECILLEETGDKNSYGWLIGIIIILLLTIIGAFSYNKYKKTNNKKPNDNLKNSINKYQKRMSGSLQRS